MLARSDHCWRLVVFDLDGTLVDSQGTIHEAMGSAFRGHQLEGPSPASVRRVVGLPLVEAVARLLPSGSPAVPEAVADTYRAAYAEITARPGFTESLFPGALEVLEELAARGVALGVATGKSRRGLLASLERYGLRERFATLQSSDDGPGKPDPTVLRLAMVEAGASAEETAMVGDTTFDIEMGKRAGVTAIGAAYGYHPAEDLRRAGADAVAEELSLVPGILARLRPFPTAPQRSDSKAWNGRER